VHFWASQNAVGQCFWCGEKVSARKFVYFSPHKHSLHAFIPDMPTLKLHVKFRGIIKDKIRLQERESNIVIDANTSKF